VYNRMSRPSERQAVSSIQSKLEEITEYLENNHEANAQDGGDFLKPLLANFKEIKRISEESVKSLKSAIELLDPEFENNNNEQDGGRTIRKHKVKKTRKHKVKKTRKH